MINIIGQHPKSEDVLALNGAHLHLYNKTEREGRKLGHITLMPVNSEELTVYAVNWRRFYLSHWLKADMTL
jgi:5-(carboxyamino)imidazole ribonucleotide synthase